MSKQKARRRAEERAKKRAPKTRAAGSAAAASNGTSAGAKPAQKKTTQRSAREERRRRRLWVIGAIWLVANALIWVLSGSGNWEAKWLGLTVTTIAVPLIVWLVWDPEGRVDL